MLFQELRPANARKYPTIEEKFWDSVKMAPGDQCWEWKKSKNKDGYGRVVVYRNIIRFAHRVSWMLCFGKIPDGILVCHKCDNPKCCRPDHLFLGTIQDNNTDRDKKGRGGISLGESHGLSVYTKEKVLQIRSMYLSGVSLSKIAKCFSGSKSGIYSIITRKTWDHVPEAKYVAR